MVVVADILVDDSVRGRLCGGWSDIGSCVHFLWVGLCESVCAMHGGAKGFATTTRTEAAAANHGQRGTHEPIRVFIEKK